jgi:hypothetical protein
MIATIRTMQGICPKPKIPWVNNFTNLGRENIFNLSNDNHGILTYPDLSTKSGFLLSPTRHLQCCSASEIQPIFPKRKHHKMTQNAMTKLPSGNLT